jgi:hypothetical protein
MVERAERKRSILRFLRIGLTRTLFTFLCSRTHTTMFCTHKQTYWIEKYTENERPKIIISLRTRGVYARPEIADFDDFSDVASKPAPKHENADAITPPPSTTSPYTPNPSFARRSSIAGGPASCSFRNEPENICKIHVLGGKITKVRCRKWSVGVSDGATSCNRRARWV